MTEKESCSRCGEPLTSEVPGRLCARCIMQMNLSPDTLDTMRGEGGSVPPLPPEELADKFPQFEILECLGRGGMGVVYKARQKALDRLVAIKILAGEWQGEAGFRERFEREAKMLAQLNHSNIVTVHDFGETAGLFYIVMEHVDGVNLRDLLRDGKMEPEQALAIVPPVCEALEYAHGKGVVHRDIKPENILLDRDGRVKIADFGIASLAGASGEKSGTPPYMAPEQSSGTVDRRADIYALGAVLYEMLTGERVDKEAVAPSRKVQVDIRIDEMVLRALEKEPERRYQTAGEFRTVVETMAHPERSSGSEVTASSKPSISVWPIAVAAYFVTNSLWAVTGVANVTGNSRLEDRLFPWLLASWLIACALWAVLLHECWKALPKKHRATTPGKAVGFLFIPFFNLYWAFVSFPKLAEGVNAWEIERGRKPDPSLKVLGVLYAINFILYWTIAWNPTVGLFVCVFDFVTFFLFYRRVVRRVTTEPDQSSESDVRPVSVPLANLALGLSVLGALIPVAFVWATLPAGFQPGDFEQNIIRGWIVSGVTLSVLVAAIGLGWSTRRLARGKAALIAASLSMLIATGTIVAGLQRPIQWDSPIVVRSPDGSMSAMGMTLHSMQIFGEDKLAYRLVVRGSRPQESWRHEVPYNPMVMYDGSVWTLDRVLFEKSGQIKWSEDGRLVRFIQEGIPITTFNTETTRWSHAAIHTPWPGQGPRRLPGKGPEEVVDLSGRDVTEQMLGELAGKTRLKRLNLQDSSISDEDLEKLSGLQNLEWVSLGASLGQHPDKPAITDAGLRHVAAWRNLRTLNLHGLPISDAGLEFLRSMPQLESLQLGATEVKGPGLAELEHLRFLRLDATPVSDTGMPYFSGLHDLEQLYIYGTSVSDEGLKHLHSLPRLRFLELSDTRVTEAGVAAIRQAIPGLEVGMSPTANVESLKPKNRLSRVDIGDNPYSPPATGKRQRFVPQAGMEDRSSWTLLPEGSALHPSGWAAMARLTLGGKARFTHPGDEKPFLEIELLKGDTDWLQLAIQDLASGNEVKDLKITVRRGEPASILVDGVGYKVLFPNQQVALDQPDTTHFATVMILEVRDEEVAFGPEEEAVLPIPRDDFPWLDLESGKFLRTADDPEYAELEEEQREAGELMDFHLKDKQASDWRKKHRVDVAGWILERPGALPAVIALDLSLVHLETDQWETLTPRELDVLLRVKPETEQRGVEGEGAVMGFRTREGSLGMLQIIGLSGDESGVKVRYKIKRNDIAGSDDEPSKSELANSNPEQAEVTVAASTALLKIKQPDGGEVVGRLQPEAIDLLREVLSRKPDHVVPANRGAPLEPPILLEWEGNKYAVQSDKIVLIGAKDWTMWLSPGIDEKLIEHSDVRVIQGAIHGTAVVRHKTGFGTLAGAIAFPLLAALGFLIHRRLNPDRRLEKTALFLCVAGVILALVIVVGIGMTRVFGIDLAVVASVAYVLFAVMQLAALILGIIRFSEPLGRAAAIASGVLLLVSALFLT